jgi:alpha-beta hydrolase superfamily lysophospholipase
MEVVKFEVKGKYDLKLSCIKVLPKKEPKAVIQMFHGMGEHKERYIPFMQYLAEHGYATYMHDHRKHGESLFEEGTYGIFTKQDTWDDVIDDCYFVSRKIMRENPGKKVVTFGHSMGSIINRLFIAKYNTVPKASIIMGTLPPYKLTTALPPILLAGTIKLFNGKKRSNFLANVLNKPMLKDYEEPRTELDWLTRDEAVVDEYIEDPLCGYAYTAQFYHQFFKGILECNKTDLLLETKDNPILFISGSADPVGNNGEGVKEVHRIFTGHGFTQLTLELVPDARHEVLNEIDKETTYEFIKNWLDSYL